MAARLLFLNQNPLKISEISLARDNKVKFFSFIKLKKKNENQETNSTLQAIKSTQPYWLQEVSESDCSIAVSSHKTILCVSQDGNIYHEDPKKNVTPLLIYQVKGGVWFLRRKSPTEFEALVNDGAKEDFRFSSTEEPIIVKIGGSSQDGVSFNLSGFNLTADLKGNARFTTKNLLSWENFALLALETFIWLQEAQKETWIESTTGKEVFFKNFDKINSETFIDCNFDVYNLSGRPGPILLKDSNKNRILMFDSFKRKRSFNKLNPLVYFCVFGSDKYYKCAALAIISLRKFGSYSGKIFLISDRPQEETLKFLPVEFRSNIEIKNTSGNSPIFERYNIYDHDIEQYSPVIYLDTDIIVGGNINEIIKDVLCSEQFCLYREVNYAVQKINESKWDAGSNWFGGWMFARNSEMGNLPFWRATSGIMMFSDHYETKKIFNMICSVGRLTRRREIDNFGDQPVMNYVVTQNENINISVLDKKSLNSGDVGHFLSNPERILMHISLGVGYGDKKLPIMEALFEKIDQKYNAKK
ncbi:hypothetical protein AD935_04085 [Gluconobacter japonicus]|nr:hypothetical protein AD935_04085 [Gluconobacter japonicus]